MGITLNDTRILRGMERQFEERQYRILAGDRPVGWKVGFGSQTAMEKLDIEAPLVGFLTQSVVLPSQETVYVTEWLNAAVEPEIALFLGEDLRAGADRITTRAAIAGVAPAIELADVNLVTIPETVEEILAANVFNRHVIVGEPDTDRAGCILNGLVGHVYRNDDEIAEVTDLEELTGDLLDIVRHVADVLGAFEKRLRAGEFLIMGSIIPPLWVTKPEEIRYRLDPLPPLSVQLKTR